MANPEAKLKASGFPDGICEDLSGSLKGWKKKFAPKRRGAPKRKDVSYIDPNGEEIKSRRQLDKYLKAHPGRLTVANFVWTAGEKPRRSLRLSHKGRHLEELELPVTKRSKRVVHDNARDTASPIRYGRGRRPGGRAATASVAGRDAVIQVAMNVEEPVVIGDSIAPFDDPPPIVDDEFLATNATEELSVDEILEDVNNVIAEVGEVAVENGVEETEQPNPMEVDVAAATDSDIPVDVPAEKVDVADILEEESQGKEAIAEVEEVKEDFVAAVVFADKKDVVMLNDTKEETSDIPTEDDIATCVPTPPEVDLLEPDLPAQALEDEETVISSTLELVKEEEQDVGAEITMISSTLVAEEKEEMVPEVVDEPNRDAADSIGEILKDEILNLITEEGMPEEGDEANATNLIAIVDETTPALIDSEVDLEFKEVDLPQLQGIHALVDDTTTFGGKTKLGEGDVLQTVPLDISHSISELGETT